MNDVVDVIEAIKQTLTEILYYDVSYVQFQEEHWVGEFSISCFCSLPYILKMLFTYSDIFGYGQQTLQ